MPVNPTYPGVYIEEIPSGVRTITGVATSVAAFIDYFRTGPINEAVQIFSFADFEREFGGLDRRSEASYAIQQFYLNGGGEAWVVRVVHESAEPAVGEIAATMTATPDEAHALQATAESEGAWGNALRMRIEPLVEEESFNLIVAEYDADDGRTLIRQEVHRNLSMDRLDPNFAPALVNDEVSGSKLVTIATAEGSRPAASGTLSGALDTDTLTLPETPRLAVSITKNGSAVERDLVLPATNGAKPSVQDLASALETAIRAREPADPAFSGASVRAVGDRLWVLPGGSDPTSRVSFENLEGTTANALRLTSQSTQGTATLSGILGADPIQLPQDAPAANSLNVTIGGIEALLELIVDPNPVTLEALRPVLETAIRNADPADTFAGATVTILGTGADQRLFVRSGDPTARPTFAEVEVGGTLDVTATTLQLTDAAGAAATTMTLSGAHTDLPVLPEEPTATVTIGGTEKPIELEFAPDIDPTDGVTLAVIAPVLETAIREADASAAFQNAVVRVAGDRLLVLPGDPSMTVSFADENADTTTAAALKLSSDATVSVAEYRFGDGVGIAGTPQLSGVTGIDGVADPGKLPPLPDGKALTGSPNEKTGIYALENVDLFNILCIPRTAILAGDDALSETEAQSIISAAEQYCAQRRAFFLMDTPNFVNDLKGIQSWISRPEIANLRDKNAALYYPRVLVPDPLNNFRLRSVGASGTMAGVYARTDSTRGVWKAPAGTDATLRNVSRLADSLSDLQNGALNPIAVNVLRTFPIFGTVAWGARTLDGADQEASEWKYVPVRRLALFLEESLFRGTKWVVFEPNDEPLWAQIRLNIGAFMQNLFRQGAFQGSSPRDAYFVKCDKDTTTQTDRNLGTVNIVVGFAPLKPAEFVIIKFQQMAGQLQA